LNASAPLPPRARTMPAPVKPLATAQELQMNHAARQSIPAGNSGFTQMTRLLMVAVALLAALIAGSAMFGHSSSAAASQVATSLPDAALQAAATTGTDPSVPQASAVFARWAPADEEACATF